MDEVLWFVQIKEKVPGATITKKEDTNAFGSAWGWGIEVKSTDEWDTGS